MRITVSILASLQLSVHVAVRHHPHAAGILEYGSGSATHLVVLGGVATRHQLPRTINVSYRSEVGEQTRILFTAGGRTRSTINEAGWFRRKLRQSEC